MAAAAIAHQNRRGQTADKRHLRHDFRILPHRQRRHRTHQPHHQHKSRARRQKRVQLHRRQRGQIHHRHAEALQNQAIFVAAALQKPARHGSCQTRAHHAQIAHFNRHMNLLRSKAQQEHQPQKQHHHAGFQQQVAVHQPIDQRSKCTFLLPLSRAGNAAPLGGLGGRGLGCRLSLAVRRQRCLSRSAGRRLGSGLRRSPFADSHRARAAARHHAMFLNSRFRLPCGRSRLRCRVGRHIFPHCRSGRREAT